MFLPIHVSLSLRVAKKDMTFGLCGVWQGVECFDYSKRLNILVTGSADHQVRVWNPYVTHKPVAVLSGHATGVIGVMVHEGFRHVFSYSKDVVCMLLTEAGVRAGAGTSVTSNASFCYSQSHVAV